LLAYGMHLPIATLVVVNWTVSTVVAMRAGEAELHLSQA
jgi:hypothetical protein